MSGMLPKVNHQLKCEVVYYYVTCSCFIEFIIDISYLCYRYFQETSVAIKEERVQQIKDWCHSISNHLYWAAATSDGDGDLVEEKWLSILNHVCDVHEGHGDRFQACEHPPLAERSWITKGKIL